MIPNRLSCTPLEDDYGPAPQIFQRIQAEFGTRTIDRFASAKNRQPPRCNSLDWDIDMEGVDACTQNCEGELNWCNPPWVLLRRLTGFYTTGPRWKPSNLPRSNHTQSGSCNSIDCPRGASLYPGTFVKEAKKLLDALYIVLGSCPKQNECH